MTTSGLCFESAKDHREWLASQAALPHGFKVGTTQFQFEPAELPRQAKMTLTVLVCDRPTEHFAAVFTRNAFPGAPVIVGRERLAGPALGAIVVNNKVSNVGAPCGVANSERVCGALAGLLGMSAGEILPSSTGVIGWRLPVREMIAALPAAVANLQSRTVLPAAEGIMTTDLYPKIRRAQLGAGSIVGIAKGAGMIEPNLATMLVYILTDLAMPRAELRRCLARAVATTFNAISIDSDQSTSDTVALISSGHVPCPGIADFERELGGLCQALAGDIVRNGEGVRHVLRVTVGGAPDSEVARGVGKSVVNSPLVQCAVCGNDPNVGRLLMAVGKYVGNFHPGLEMARCAISMGGETLYADGEFRLGREAETRLVDYLKNAELYASAPPDERGVFRPAVNWPPHERCVEIAIDLGCGPARFTVLGSDRTHEYISENADYRS